MPEADIVCLESAVRSVWFECSFQTSISECDNLEIYRQLSHISSFSLLHLLYYSSPNISDTYLTIDSIQIPLVLVKTNDFTEIYQAIDATKRKIPARVLRYCKEQLYELVKSSEPEKKICVVDIDEIDKKEDIEFLVGVGVAAKEQTGPSAIGYASIGSVDLIKDLLYDNENYDYEQILKCVLPRASRSTPYIPTFKYLSKAGINSLKEYEESEFKLDKVVKKPLQEYQVSIYSKSFLKRYQEMSMQEIIESCTPENAAAYIPFLPIDKIDQKALHSFLLGNSEKFEYATSSYASNFRKLAAIYDRLKFGWPGV